MWLRLVAAALLLRAAGGGAVWPQPLTVVRRGAPPLDF